MMIYAITCAFIVLDFATGLIKAVATDKFKSSMMRQGLFHKVGEILCVALGILIQYAEGYLDLGINLPVAAAICTYIVLMEIGSAGRKYRRNQSGSGAGKVTQNYWSRRE